MVTYCTLFILQTQSQAQSGDSTDGIVVKSNQSILYFNLIITMVQLTGSRSVTNWEFVLEANETPKVLGSGAYGTVSTLTCCDKYVTVYHRVPGKHLLLGKCPCSSFQRVNVAVSIQTCESYIWGKQPCGPKSRVMFKRPWALTRY